VNFNPSCEVKLKSEDAQLLKRRMEGIIRDKKLWKREWIYRRNMNGWKALLHGGNE
jgi:hypothetical protein